MPTGSIGFSSLGRGSYRTPLEHGADFAVDFVELTMNDYPPATLVGNADDIRAIVDEGGIDLIVHLPHGSEHHMLGSSDDGVRTNSREQFEKSLDAAAAIGAKKGVIHVDASANRLLLEVDRRDTLVDAVDELARYAQARDIELCVENMRGTTRRRLGPDDVARIAHETAAAMTLDTGHARTVGYSDADIAGFLSRHGDVVSHFHLNDTRGPSDDHLPFGAGSTDFTLIFGALPDDWTGTFTLEVGVPSYEYIEVSISQLQTALDRAHISRPTT